MGLITEPRRAGWAGVLVFFLVGCGSAVEHPATPEPPAVVEDVVEEAPAPGFFAEPMPFGETRSAVATSESTGSGKGSCTLERYIDGVRYRCRHIQGTFTNQFLTGEACLPPSTTCTTGQLRGDVKGTYEFYFLSQVPSGEANRPQRQLFIGESTVTTDDGLLFGDDFGTIEFLVGQPSPFRTLIDLQDGTGEFDDVRGHILAKGEVDLVTGQGGGTYSGEVCRPAEDDLLAAP